MKHKHFKLFEDYIAENNGSWQRFEKTKILHWVDEVENFVNTIKDAELAGEWEIGFDESSVRRQLAKLVYGWKYDLQSPEDLRYYRDEADSEAITEYLGVQASRNKMSDDSPENSYGSGVSPEVDKKILNAYKKMDEARENMGSQLLNKLSNFLNHVSNETAELLQVIEGGEFCWDEKTEYDCCTPSRLRDFMENLETYRSPL